MTDDSDSPWKEVLERFLPECLKLLDPELFSAVDWSRGFEVDKTAFPVPTAEGTSGRAVDFLAKVRLRDGTEEGLFLHIEVQGYYEKEFAERVFDSWTRVRLHCRSTPQTLVLFVDGRRAGSRSDTGTASGG